MSLSVAHSYWEWKRKFHCNNIINTPYNSQSVYLVDGLESWWDVTRITDDVMMMKLSLLRGVGGILDSNAPHDGTASKHQTWARLYTFI